MPAGMAVVRMDLTTGGEKVPASWALVQVLLANGGAAPTVVAEGIADARGCALVLFPYPEPRDLLPASRVLIGTEFTRHSWDVQCRVFHSGIDAGTEPPDLMAILAQRSGQPALIADGTAAGSRVMSGRLEQGRELILRSPASRFSKLIIHPQEFTALTRKETVMPEYLAPGVYVEETSFGTSPSKASAPRPRDSWAPPATVRLRSSPTC